MNGTKILGIGLFGFAAIGAAAFPAIGSDAEYPISMYLTYDGKSAEWINKLFHNNQENLYNLQVPLYAGLVVVRANGEMTCFSKNDFTEPELRHECADINRRNGVITYIEPRPGQISLKGVAKTDPGFVEAFTHNVWLRCGFDVARITYGDEPDLSWAPGLENARAYVPLEERARREQERSNSKIRKAGPSAAPSPDEKPFPE